MAEVKEPAHHRQSFRKTGLRLDACATIPAIGLAGSMLGAARPAHCGHPAVDRYAAVAARIAAICCACEIDEWLNSHHLGRNDQLSRVTSNRVRAQAMSRNESYLRRRSPLDHRVQ